MIEASKTSANWRHAFWWVNALTALCGGLPIAISAVTFDSVNVGPFFGIGLISVIYLPYVAAFVLAATAVSVLSVLFARRWLRLVSTRRFPRLAVFAALSIGWVVAWVLSVVILGPVVTGVLRLAGAVVSDGALAAFGDEVNWPTYFVWTLPALVGYVVVSAIVCAIAGRGNRRRASLHIL